MGGFLQILRVADGHEFHQDVGLAEVAKAPAQRGNHHDDQGAHAGGVREEGEEVRAFFREDIHGRSGAAQSDGSGYRHIQHGKEHHGALDQVRQSDSREAAEEGVEDHHEGADQKRFKVGQAEDGIEKLAGSHEARRGVDDEEKNNKERTDEAEPIFLIFEAVRQIVRDGEAIIGHFGVVAKPFGNQEPIRPGADDEADAGPECGKAMEIGVARKSHEHPAAHVRRLGAHGREPRTHFAIP